MLYAQSTGGFYYSAVHGANIPADAIPISNADYAELLQGQSHGKRIVPDSTGRPILIDPPQPTFGEELERIVASINKWRDAQEQQLIVFEHAGRNWDGGLAVRTRLQPVVALPALPEGFFWTDADNVDVPMDKPALEALNAAHEAAIVARGFEIHVRQRQMKQEVAALDTVEALQAYVIGWPEQ